MRGETVLDLLQVVPHLNCSRKHQTICLLAAPGKKKLRKNFLFDGEPYDALAFFFPHVSFSSDS